MSSLHRAAQIGNPAEVERLLQAGADPNERGKHDETPMFPAVRSGDLATIHLLLNYGADLLAASAHNVLHSNAHTHPLKRYLLDLGLPPDHRLKPTSLTPAAFFASFRNRELVDLYLAYGADPLQTLHRSSKTIQDCLADPDHWRDLTPKTDQSKLESQIHEMSNHLAISPQEYVARHRNILIFGYQDVEDPECHAWAEEVRILLNSPERLIEAYDQFLTGPEREKAIYRANRNIRRREKEEAVQRIRDEYTVRMNLPTLPPF